MLFLNYGLMVHIMRNVSWFTETWVLMLAFLFMLNVNSLVESPLIISPNAKVQRLNCQI